MDPRPAFAPASHSVETELATKGNPISGVSHARARARLIT